MGLGRFIYQNAITAISMITVSSQRTGKVSPAIKVGQGVATMQTKGDFSGDQSLEYTIKIDSVAAGQEVGQATFRWTDGIGDWNATGVTTASTWITLNNGVQIKWTAQSGADFSLWDKWYLNGHMYFGKTRLLDLDRNTFYRSNGLDNPNTLVIDFGEVKQIDTFILLDHNISSAATINLQANTADSWGSPAFDVTVPYNAEKIIYYLASAQSYRYWRVKISDASNPDGHIQVGNLFLGAYFEPGWNYEFNWTDEQKIIEKKLKSRSGINWRWGYNLQKTIRIEYKYLSDSNFSEFVTMLEAIFDKPTHTIKHVYWNRDSSVPGDTWLMEFPASLKRKIPFFDLQNVKLQLREAVKDI